MKAEFKCTKCKYEYSHAAGPTNCLACGEKYVEWTNYDIMLESGYFNEEKQNEPANDGGDKSNTESKGSSEQVCDSSEGVRNDSSETGVQDSSS